MLFTVRCTDRTDQPGVRAATRNRHLDYLRSLGDSLLLAGPLLGADGETPIGSFLILKTPDRKAAEEIVAQDPFARVGLFGSVEMAPFRITISNPIG